VVRDEDTIVALLTRLGAPRSALARQQHRLRRPVRTTVNQPATFADANQRRIAQAAAEMVTQVQRTLEMLGEDIPKHLLVAGRLRVQHHQASLAELGQLADPPLTKDAIAGRIRRLLILGNNHTHHHQTPNTTAPNMLDSTTDVSATAPTKP
jgi:DNA-binding protein WhiA